MHWEAVDAVPSKCSGYKSPRLRVAYFSDTPGYPNFATFGTQFYPFEQNCNLSTIEKFSFEEATILLSCQHIIFLNPAYKVIDFLD